MGAGKQFDPRLVEVFLRIASQFREIAQQYPETMDVEQIAADREIENLLTPSQEQFLVSLTVAADSQPLTPAAAPGT
jgi:hypothetical protein